MESEKKAALREAVFRGESVLLLGQDHSPEVVDRVLAEAHSVIAGHAAWATLPEMYAALGDDADARRTVSALLAAQSPSVDLVEIASLPWAAVVTTAVDQAIRTALRPPGSVRSLLELGGQQAQSVAQSRVSHAVYLLRAFGAAGEDPPLAVPTGAEIDRVRMFDFPKIAELLPVFLGLRGCLLIDGLSTRDWLDEHSFRVPAMVLGELPAGRVFWFGQVPSAAAKALAGRCTFLDLRLAELIKDWANDSACRSELQAAKQRAFGVGDRLLRLRSADKEIEVVLGAQDWREAARAGSIVDEALIAALKVEKPSREAQRPALVNYLRRSHAGVPDWSGPAHGRVFVRNATRELIGALESFLAKPKPSVHAGRAGPTRGPFLIAGPPAAGKTMGLLHAAWSLRTAGHCVVWLLPGVTGVDLVALERVVRVLESRGVEWVLVFVDGLTDVEEYTRMQRRLEADGRNVTVVGAFSTFEHGIEKSARQRVFYLNHALDDEELRSFEVYLCKHDVAVPAPSGRDFLRLLNAATPEMQGGALPALIEEYSRLLDEARNASAHEAGKPPHLVPGSLGAQLKAKFPALFAQGTPATEELATRFDSDTVLKELVQTVLFCSQIEKPITVDVLLKVLGSGLIERYSRYQEAFSRTALIETIELDQFGTEALTTGHALRAKWLLRGLCPDRRSQLEILQRVTRRIDWAPDALPGERPVQDFVMEVLRLVGPRGPESFKPLYSSQESLDFIGEILRDIRTRTGKEMPKLLTLEAIVLGDLAERESASTPEKARDRCRRALHVLERAESLLRERPASEARSFELQRVLTLSCDMRGTFVNTYLRAPGQLRLDEVRAQLDEIHQEARQAYTYAQQWHPLDIVCWTHKDVLERVPDLDDAEHARFLARIEGALEAVDEAGGIEAGQETYYGRRQRDLLHLRGQWTVSEEIAREMREAGDYSGELSLSRARMAHDLTRRRRDERSASLLELERLSGFRPGILQSLDALRFLHRLWMNAYAGGPFRDNQPKLVGASKDVWQLLEEVTRERQRHEEDSELVYPLFCYGWALYQLEEVREAQVAFSRLERLSVGMSRRVGELAYLTDMEGNARILPTRVVDARSNQATVKVIPLDLNLALHPRVQTRLAPAGLSVGQFLDVSIALNYRGVQALPPVGR